MLGLNASAIAFLSLSATCAVVATVLTYQEIGEVNRQLPAEGQIRYLFMYPGKMTRIRAEYRRFYPRGRVDLWRLMFQWAMFGFLGLTAISAGFLQ